MQKTTLLYLYKANEKQILLGMKKRRFGTGKWNGVGGKLEKGENIKEALVREIKEEIDVTINPDDLKQVATLDFRYTGNPEWNQQSHVFFIEKWQGEPIETEEIIPKWHDVNSLPYENMWLDDIHWLPLVLRGRKVKASFVYNKTGDIITHKKVEEI
ncbi:MAG TPA: 8-oxo-dGTP diphosphatase [Candidatus Paceibacterota bacterium]|jgi:8-oxo-dGTP pyrophosphatase MutT (NUDIX family)|nr:8-oxo-dGTP diphosphatase [Candidatus Paceibacterota bacterium]